MVGYLKILYLEFKLRNIKTTVDIKIIIFRPIIKYISLNASWRVHVKINETMYVGTSTKAPRDSHL